MLLSELAEKLNLTLQGQDIEINGVGTLSESGPDQVSFLANPKYQNQLGETRAGAVILSEDMADQVHTALISSSPYLDFARTVQLFARPQDAFDEQSSQAFIHPTAQVDPSVCIHPFVYVGPKARIEAGTRIFSGSYIGEDCLVGKNCLIYPNVSLMAGTCLGDNVTLHAGVVLGSDGFGFAQAAYGMEKFPQIGKVIIADDVEIGANTTIDRAALGETKVGQGCKIDNLVQLGHNVEVGEHSIIVAQVGVAGSTKIGKKVILAGQVGLAGHLEIGDGCRVGAKSGVNHSLPPGQDVSGAPAIEHSKFLKASIIHGKLPEMSKRLRRLEKELQQLKKQIAREEND